MSARAEAFDVIVVGAGFSGLYCVHHLRELGFSVRALEQGDGVGGTWFWNRYPGARCDLESIEYSYSFSDEIQQEWVWSDRLPAQAEIEAYLNFVADRLDLRRDIQLRTRVAAMHFDEAERVWNLETEAGERFTAPFVIAATGILSTPLLPDIPGAESFEGASLLSGLFPREGFDFRGKRAAIIGTGSSGVQATPVVAAQAAHLTVFQRSAAYTLPSSQRPLEPGELDALKADYAQIRAAQRETYAGAARTGAFTAMSEAFTRPAIKSASPEERLRAVEERGIVGALFWSDVLSDIEANEIARELYGLAVARIVRDPETAAALVPDYPFGCKRPIIDEGYYETFNRDNVTLVDLRRGAITRVTPTGIETEQGHFELDVILYATGFDAMTGALSRIEVRGRDRAVLGEVWGERGPVSYLGIQVAGFPNLFTVVGPGSPGALANVVHTLEYSVDWIADCLVHLRESGLRSIEARPEAQEDWVKTMASLVEGSVATHPSCHSWYLGANVPGKKRVYSSFAGGVPEYRRLCDEIAKSGYAGFELS